MDMHVLLCLSTAVIMVVAENTYQNRPLRYGVLLDAGSSGTKIKVYRWPQRRSSKEIADINLIESMKYRPNIGSFVHHLQDISNYLVSMINIAEEIVPTNLHRNTPIYLMATAGLRIISEDFSEILMDSVRDVFSNSTLNPFVFHDDGVQILSGEEEGVFAWIAANFLRGFFGSGKPPTQAVGVLEMGGGSTQITFIPDGPVYANMFHVRLAGDLFYLYAHSYLYFGQNYIDSRINTYVLTTESLSSHVTNPCRLRGDDEYVKHENKSVLIKGGGDAQKCLEILNVFLKSAEDHKCYPKPCAIGQTYQPDLGSDVFFATQAFKYAPRALQAVDSLGRLQLEKMKEAAIQYCAQTLDEVTNGTTHGPQYASSNCIMGLYIPVLLTNGYGFPMSTKNIYIVDKIRGQAVDWAMGAMLYKMETVSIQTTTCQRKTRLVAPLQLCNRF
ncbi:hypothetical protein ScPMuIL_013714 [Solemya velum]